MESMGTDYSSDSITLLKVPSRTYAIVTDTDSGGERLEIRSLLLVF
jgi:hypothetical protein